MFRSRRRARRLIRRPAAAIMIAVALVASCSLAAVAIADPDDLSGGQAARPHIAALLGRSPRELQPRPFGLPGRAASRRGWPGSPGVNVYAHTLAGMLTPVTRRARYLVYVPDS